MILNIKPSSTTALQIFICCYNGISISVNLKHYKIGLIKNTNKQHHQHSIYPPSLTIRVQAIRTCQLAQSLGSTHTAPKYQNCQLLKSFQSTLA